MTRKEKNVLVSKHESGVMTNDIQSEMLPLVITQYLEYLYRVQLKQVQIRKWVRRKQVSLPSALDDALFC